MWACRGVGIWACGHVGMWACRHLPYPALQVGTAVATRAGTRGPRMPLPILHLPSVLVAAIRLENARNGLGSMYPSGALPFGRWRPLSGAAMGTSKAGAGRALRYGCGAEVEMSLWARLLASWQCGQKERGRAGVPSPPVPRPDQLSAALLTSLSANHSASSRSASRSIRQRSSSQIKRP
jgi:hypothetical protein